MSPTSRNAHHDFAMAVHDDIPWYPRVRFMVLPGGDATWVLVAVQARETVPGAGKGNYSFKLNLVRLGMSEPEARALAQG